MFQKSLPAAASRRPPARSTRLTSPASEQPTCEHQPTGSSDSLMSGGQVAIQLKHSDSFLLLLLLLLTFVSSLMGESSALARRCRPFRNMLIADGAFACWCLTSPPLEVAHRLNYAPYLQSVCKHLLSSHTLRQAPLRPHSSSSSLRLL
ncbi:hypothetical protein CesoFtcFv8_012008 [Champsocephalus esox]|uniref:Uncharacterized protein n=1 Tax=Champsocephalus esox TaxID=159716 RepID=A0AAN8C250_9TELE|nr:hypothetical protein CesoFtcFv8_012008 [Champsocephalus esox]